VALRNPYPGKTEAQLLAALDACVSELLSGSQLESATAGDVSSARRVTHGADDRKRKILIALHCLDPDKYGTDDIPPSRSVAVMGGRI
jgi:hypothetical protein